ncbi:MAG: PAS domain S-box protein [Armatimonadota bacterium]
MSLSIKQKALLIFAISMGLFAVILYAGSWYLMYSGIKDLESEIAVANLQRVNSEYDSDITSMDIVAQDWSRWRFAKTLLEPGTDRPFKDVSATFPAGNVDHIVVLNKGNKTVWQRSRGLNGGSRIIPTEILTSLRNYVMSNPCPVEGDCRNGIILLPKTILLVVAQGIVDPARPGVNQGQVLVSRSINREAVNRLQRFTGLPIDIYRVDDRNLPGNVKAVLSQLSLTQQVQQEGQGVIYSYQSINDLNGRPALIMKVTTPRSLAQRTDFPRHYILLTIIGAAALFGFMMLYLVYKTILNRMLDLKGEVSAIANAGDLNARVHIGGGDEIAHLATQVNQMLESLQTAVQDKTDSDQLRETISDSAFDIMLVLDTHLRIQYLNRNACGSLQTTPDNAMGRYLEEILGDENGSELISTIERTLKLNNGGRVELILGREDARHYLQMDVVPLCKPNGRPDRVLLTGKDVTYARNLEEVIQQQLRFEAKLVDTIPIPVAFTDTSGSYLAANRAWAETLGMKVENILKHTVTDIFPRQFAEGYLQLVDQAKLQDEPVHGELTLIRQDGTTRQVVLFSSSYRSIDGSLLGTITAVMDITELKSIQSALQASEARYRGIVDSQNDLVVRCGVSGDFTFVNQACSITLGISVEELLGSNINRFVLPDDLPLVNECVENLKIAPHRQTLTHQVPCLRGIRWIEWECVAILDDKGAITEFQLSGRDVTIQKQMHDELEQRVQERTRELAEVNNMLRDQLNFAHMHAEMANRMIGITPDHLESRYVRANQEMALSCDGNLLDFWVFGVDQARFQPIARWFDKRVYSGECNVDNLNFEKLDWLMGWLRTGKSLVVHDLAELPVEAAAELSVLRRYDVQAIIVCPVLQQNTIVGMVYMGSRRPRPTWGESEAALLRLYGETLMLGYERSRAQMEVVQSEARFRTLFERSAMGIALTDIEWHFISVNNALAQLLGYTESELGDLTMENITHLDDLDSDANHISTLLSGRMTECRMQRRLIRKDGQIIWVSMIVFILNSSDEGTILVSTIEDITSEKRAQEDLQNEREMLEQRVQERTAQITATNQELARANRMKDEFLANMSHELRTPLNAIIGISEAMDEGVFGQVGDMQRDALGRVHDSGHHLLSLINDILDLSKIEAGKVAPNYEVVDLNMLGSDCMRMVKDIAHKKHLDLVVNIPPDMAPMVADGRRLKQILVNLISNAVKFTPDHGRVELHVEQGHDGMVVFKVTDTGIGISDENLARLFQPFHQVDSGLNRKFEGTGLGLALVKKLAELHNGTVSAQSMVGKGSSFIVRIPYRPAPEALSVNNSCRVNLRRALVVASGDMERLSIEVALQKQGVEVQTVCSTIQAPGDIRRFKPELVVMHLDMEDGAGWHLLDRLKGAVSDGEYALVAITDQELRQEAIACGASASLTYPLDAESVQICIDRFAKDGLEGSSKAMPDRGSDKSEHHRQRLVLLAEDNEISAELFTTYLSNKGYQVSLASNGREAYDLAVSLHPDIILMDVQMPEVNGIEATRMIREIPELKNTPLVMLTALAMQGDRERCLESGADDYLSKPVRLAQLLGTITKFIG